MSNNKYRAFLLFLLVVVCILLYYATDVQFKKMIISESMAAIKEDDDHYKVMPSGKPIGIYVKTDGVMVIDTGEIEAVNGKTVSPCKGILFQGDYVLSVNEREIEDKDELIDYVKECNGASLTLGIVRNKKELSVKVVPCQNIEGNYMLGLWVKDDISGIGTLTYVSDDDFGALGHSINDNDTGDVFAISDGAIYGTNLVNIVKTNGTNPGRLEGMIDYSSKNVWGRVDQNDVYGIKGHVTKTGESKLNEQQYMEVAKKYEAHTGKAYLLSGITGKPTYYEINIEDINFSSNSGNKGIQIKVTDSRLINLTGGIVQGMSGTPIIQDGRLLGAVTHVFLRDSTKGYGTFVCDMIEKND